MASQEIVPDLYTNYDYGLMVGGPARRVQQQGYMRWRAHKAAIASGEMPAVGSGFSFVIDYRPAGHKDDHIPAKDFAGYFQRRQVPIAAPDHGLHAHDLGHIYAYQWLFEHQPVADMVQLAAEKAVGNAALSAYFTDATDRLSGKADAIIAPPLGTRERHSITGTSRHIVELSHLAMAGEMLVMPADSLHLPPSVNRLWNELSLAAHDSLGLHELYGQTAIFAPVHDTDSPFVFVAVPSY